MNNTYRPILPFVANLLLTWQCWAATQTTLPRHDPGYGAKTLMNVYLDVFWFGYLIPDFGAYVRNIHAETDTHTHIYTYIHAHTHT